MTTASTDPPPFGGHDLGDITPPPPPPPSAASRRRGIGLGRRGAAAAVAGGLVVGGIAGGYVVSRAASSPAATATPSTGPFDGHHGGGGWGAGGPSAASRTEDLTQAAAAIGITEAQLQAELTGGKTIAAVASAHNVKVATVISTLVADENKEIDALVTAGSLTQAQAAQIKTQTTQRVTDMVNGTMPSGHPGGFGGPSGARSEDSSVIAGAIGITTTQLSTELTAGKTIAAIATEHSSTAAKVISALVASENAEIDQHASSGQVTAAEAAQEKAETTQRVTDLVNGVYPAGGPGPFFAGPGPGMGPDGSSTGTSA